MAPHREPEIPRLARRLTALTLFAVLAATLGTAGLRADPPVDDVYTWKERTFRIPFQATDPSSGGIRDVYLYVSEDFGKTYAFAGRAIPGQSYFSYSAPHDGVFYFVTQIEGRDGKRYPPDLSSVQPFLKIRVDTGGGAPGGGTGAPVILVNPATPTVGSVAIEWTVQGAGADPGTLRGWYRPKDSAVNFTPLDLPRQLTGYYSWTPAFPGPAEVYLEIYDRSGRLGKSVPRVVTPGMTGAGPGTATGPSGPPGVKFVNRKEFPLKFDFEAMPKSDIAHVEVYLRHEAEDWKLHPELEGKGKASPLTIRVQEEGRYGIYLLPVSGVGLREFDRPTPSTPPQLVVEIDTTPPEVKMPIPPEVGKGPDSGKMTIKWDAKDKHFGPTPIRLSYSTQPTGNDWKAIADQLPNEGLVGYVWRLPPDPPVEMYVRVEATDLAGNTASVVSPAVKVDLIVPRVRNVTLDPLPGAPTNPGQMPGP